MNFNYTMHEALRHYTHLVERRYASINEEAYYLLKVDLNGKHEDYENKLGNLRYFNRHWQENSCYSRRAKSGLRQSGRLGNRVENVQAAIRRVGGKGTLLSGLHVHLHVQRYTRVSILVAGDPRV